MRRGLLVGLVVLAVLGVGGYVADAAVRGRVESEAASALRTRLSLDQAPQVSLGGFPFTLALLTGTVPDARATAAQVPLEVGTSRVSLSGVRVQASGISLAGDTVRVARAEATGVLDYGDLSAIIGVPVAYAGDGRITATYTVDAGPQDVSVGITALPVLDTDAGTIRLTEPEQDTSSRNTIRLSKAQLARVAAPIPVALGDGARLVSFAPSEGGVAVAAVVTGVSLPVA